MAITIYDPIGGLKPVGGPLEIVEFTADSTAIKMYGVVGLTAGLLTRTAATGGGQIGVVIAPVAASGKALVNIHPDTIYEATIESADNVVAQADIGKGAFITAESSTTNYSNQYVNMTSASTTITGDMVVRIVGLPKNTTNVTAASNKKVLVKLLNNVMVDGA